MVQPGCILNRHYSSAAKKYQFIHGREWHGNGVFGIISVLTAVFTEVMVSNVNCMILKCTVFHLCNLQQLQCSKMLISCLFHKKMKIKAKVKKNKVYIICTVVKSQL